MPTSSFLPTTWWPALRRTISVVTLVGFGLLATGCGTTTTSTSNPIQVRVWRLNQDPDTLKTYISQFKHQYPTVNVTYSKHTIDDYELDTLTSLAARQGPDVWSIPSDWLGDHQPQIVALPSNYYEVKGQKTTPSPVDEVRQLYPSGIADQLITPDNKVLGVPTNVDTLELYYSSDFFSSALSNFRKSLGNNYSDTTYQPVRQLLNHPPTTWSELLDQTRYLTQRSGTALTKSAIALGTADNTPNANDILQLLMLQNGAKIVSSDRKTALFHIPTTTASGAQVNPGQNALDFFSSFSNPTTANYSWNPSMPSAMDAFATGELGMVIATSDFGVQLKTKYPHFSFQTAAVPQISSTQPPVNFITFSVETVTQTADNQSAAFAFTKTYTSSDAAQSLASDQKLLSPYTSTLQKRVASDFRANQILTGQTVYKIHRTQFDAAFRQMILDVSQNGLPSQQALDKGAESINTLLGNTTHS